MADPKEKEVKDLVKDLRLAAGDPNNQDWGRAVFLIGAGCCYSAGIPLAGGIAKGCIIKLAKKIEVSVERTTWFANKHALQLISSL